MILSSKKEIQLKRSHSHLLKHWIKMITLSLQQKLKMNKDQLGKEICQIFERMWLILAQKKNIIKGKCKAVIAKIATNHDNFLYICI